MKIFFIGMMGSGKTYWTKLLAKKYKVGGYDLDEMITIFEEKSIKEIFEEDGEDYFRKTESKILHWFAQKKSFFLATGGGTPCYFSNMQWMNQNGVTVWIDEPIEVLVERLKNEKSHRPLISQLSEDELASFLRNKLLERSPAYQKATHRLSGTQISEKSLVNILKQYA